MPENEFAVVFEKLKRLRAEAAVVDSTGPDYPPRNSVKIYEETELHIAQHEIRLLILHPGTFADQIQCSLRRVSLDETNDYEALSYTWGQQNGYNEIFVEGEVFWATRNLEAALRHLRLAKQARTLWIDAICINQQSIPERNEQVAQMREIYRSARRVCVWLGDEESITSVGMEFIQDVHAYFPNVHVQVEPDGLNASLYHNGSALQKGFLAVDSSLQANYRRAHYAYGMVEELPWWSRIWVIQEIAMAKDAVVGHGRKWIPWSSFELWGHIDDAARSKPFGRGTWLRLLTMIRARQQHGVEISLLRLLQYTARCEATVPHDKIFAILGLATEVERKKIRIDYGLSLEQLYIDTVKSLIIWDQSLEIIGSVTEPVDVKLPSWVPCFNNRHSAISNPLSVGKYCASANVSPEVMFGQSDGLNQPTMAVKGIKFDDIVAVVKDRVTLENAESLTSKCMNLRIPDTDIRHSLDRRASLWKVCIADRGEGGHVPASPKFQKMHELLRGPGATTPRFSGGQSELGSFVKPYKENMEYVTANRVLFATSAGFVGLGPKTIEVGDAVVLLFGSHVPYILRPQHANCDTYSLVGETYVHGIMYGELVKLYQNAGPEDQGQQVFCIV